jgi:hypothetical protein
MSILDDKPLNGLATHLGRPDDHNPGRDMAKASETCCQEHRGGNTPPFRPATPMTTVTASPHTLTYTHHTHISSGTKPPLALATNVPPPTCKCDRPHEKRNGLCLEPFSAPDKETGPCLPGASSSREHSVQRSTRRLALPSESCCTCSHTFPRLARPHRCSSHFLLLPALAPGGMRRTCDGGACLADPHR